MAEPNTVAGICGATATTAGLCTLAGLQLDLMVLALFGAVLVSYVHPQIDKRSKAFAAVFFGALTATYGSPFISLVVANKLADGQVVDGLPQMLALLMGGALPALLVPLLKRAKREIDKGGLTP